MNKKALLLSLLCFTSVAMRATDISVDAQIDTSSEIQIVSMQETELCEQNTLADTAQKREEKDFSRDTTEHTMATGFMIGTLSGGAIAIIVNTILDTVLSECGTPCLPIIKLVTRIGCKKIWGNALNEKLVAKAIETDNKNHYKMFNEAMLKTVSRTTAWILIVSPITLA